MRDERRKELFEKIYRTYKEDLQRFIFSLSLRNVDDMDDIFQNTMEAAYKNLGKLKNESRMKSWIFEIAKQEVRRYYSKKKNHKGLDDDGLYIDITSMAETANLEDFVKDIVDADELVQLINELSDKMQSIIFLHYYYDLPLAEISEIRQINLNTVKSIHKRALAQMKTRFERKGR